MDAIVPWLGITVHPSGTKTFFFRRRRHRVDSGRISIGRYMDGPVQDMTIEQAREAAGKLNQKMNAGVAPEGPRTSRGVTWAEFHAIYIEDHARVHKKTWRQDQRQYDNHLARWGPMYLVDISRQDVVSLFAGIVTGGHPHTANRVLAQARVMFELAISWGYHPGPNPAAGVKKKAMPPRDRKVERSEFPALFRALEWCPSADMKDVFFLAMFTGARIGRILSMRACDISLGERAWSMPDSKTGDPVRVPLSSAAMDILVRRLDRSPGPWVFPSGSSKSGHIVSVGKVWQKICARAGIENLRPHDLRRTMVSTQANGGVNLAIASKTVGHKNLETTRKIYTVVDFDPMRQAVELVALEIKKMGAAEHGSGDGSKMAQGDHGSTERHA